MAWDRRMNLGPNPDENEEPGARLGRITPSGWKKRSPGASSGRRVEMLLDIEFKSFGEDPRNIRLGASTDGFNPFGNKSITHSTWSVFVWIYNLPTGCA
jgi:hypothetical protein